MTLFKHKKHAYSPMNPNLIHTIEQSSSDINQKLAVRLTRIVGTMWTAYSFMALAFIGLAAILGWLSPLVALLVGWISQTFIQLVLLPVIMVGQNVLSRKQEIQADETYEATLKSFHDIEQIMLHLNAQDEELLKQSSILLEILGR